MPLSNNITIQYGSRSVGGGDGTYQLNGPYSLDKSFNGVRITAEVIVVSSSGSGLQSASEALEDDFRKRDQDITVTVGGSSWQYRYSDHTLLNSTASLSKTGNPETDRGYSRAYTLVIEGTLPADDDDGLSVLDVTVDFDPGRRRIISMRGLYTAFEGTDAAQQYQDDFDDRATTIITAIDSAGTYELVSENFSRDRKDHECNFSRQYQQVLYDQGSAGLDNPAINDHRVMFSNNFTVPGDFSPDGEGLLRLRRTSCTFEAYLNIEEDDDVKALWDDEIRDWLINEWKTTFSPQVFAVEDVRTTFDETAKRLQASLQMLYQPEGGTDVVESSLNVAYRETRNLDLTPIHGQSEYSYVADLGWATRDRIWTRQVTVIGNQLPRTRIGEAPQGGGGGGPAGSMPDLEGLSSPDSRGLAGSNVVVSDWAIISATSSVEPTMYGVSDIGETFEATTLSEVVTERYFKKPTASGPITPGGSQ